ncbi:hypothetical protein BGZ46_005756, partial [Entomortierella lignicola]
PADEKAEKAPTPYDRNRQAKEASISRALRSTTTKQASTSKTENRAIPVGQASPSETGVPPSPVLLNCIVEKESSSFSVEILSSKNVGALKDAIKKKKEPRLNHIAADELILKLSPDGGVTKKGLEKLTESSLKVLDDELQELSTYFPEKPAKNLIHIVVKLPEQ